ncbi:hypothetical protein L21_1655 [Methanoculleus chikugoensis]|uniref:Uncharacterized protein n=1 Tax=Methanoculleus chikugoensis TaxID=118126 RepID=A0A1M4MLI2_9EURY|nr:hypothetical protein [Methanoculleus chikugoensis]SCL75743.1 hypothetical protein L21_1655 [Methanoculleus chikugoensis]
MARQCTICTHPQRAEIDQAIVSGEKYRSISQRFDVSEAAIGRHKKHISAAVVDAERQKAVSGTAKMLKELSRGFDSLARAANRAEEEGDDKKMAYLWKTAGDLAKPLLQIAGDLPGDGTTINIYQSPQWLKIQAVIFRELQPYPDIRVRLAEALKEVEDS